MKTIVAISDSHGNRSAFEKLNGVFSECDYIIHLGDTSADGLTIKKKYGDKVYLLNGNCDVFGVGEDEITLEIEGVNIFCCHGDAYGVKRGLDRLAAKAEELGCDVALYGHTHIAEERKIGSVTLFNPGCLTRFSENSYLYLVLHDGCATGKIVKF